MLNFTPMEIASLQLIIFGAEDALQTTEEKRDFLLFDTTLQKIFEGLKSQYGPLLAKDIKNFDHRSKGYRSIFRITEDYIVFRLKI